MEYCLPHCCQRMAERGFTGLRCEVAFLIDTARNDYKTTYVRVFSEKGGRIVINTDFGTGVVSGPAAYRNGFYVLDLKPGETAVISGEKQVAADFTPLPGNDTEDHFFGVKRVRRF